MKWIYISLGSISIVGGLITFWLPVPIGIPLLMIGVPLIMNHSNHGRQLLLQLFHRWPVLYRKLKRLGSKGP
ncbi:MAG: hypothetical protein PVF52_06090 [Granulosicoccaceae bacterium]|jgi:hypothetical protein